MRAIDETLCRCEINNNMLIDAERTLDVDADSDMDRWRVNYH